MSNPTARRFQQQFPVNQRVLSLRTGKFGTVMDVSDEAVVDVAWDDSFDDRSSVLGDDEGLLIDITPAMTTQLLKKCAARIKELYEQRFAGI